MIESDIHKQRAIEKIDSCNSVIANSIANKGFIVSFRPLAGDGSKGKSIDVDVKVVVEELNVPSK
jgi:hypothetical protein